MIKPWLALGLAITIVVAVMATMARWAIAQEVKDCPLYRVMDIPKQPGLYKTVYQGCEIFIAVGDMGLYPHSTAISTGRNCH